MTISASLSNALSGLTAAARSAEVVSSNVANATTEGYGRRTLVTSSRSVAGSGAGVQVEGVRRNTDQLLLADRREAQAQSSGAGVVAGFYADLETAVGIPGEPGSLTDRLASFEAALAAASSRPDSDTRLAGAVNAATSLATKFNELSDTIQNLRVGADREIAQQVDLLNDRLGRIGDLNGEILRALTSGGDATALMDLRAVAIDDIASVVSLRVVPRDHGQVAIYTQGGATLLDGKPGSFGFSHTGTIVPEMTVQTAALSGLSLNGTGVSTSGPYAPIGGGSLAALFELRDDLAVSAQAELDAVARDITERFQEPGLDPSLSGGAAGLFTDGGSPFSASNEVGISSRITVNPLVDPSSGGAVWRIRSGLGSSAPGPVGDSSLLNAFGAALEMPLVANSGGLAGASRSASGFVGEYLSMVGRQRQEAENDLGYLQAKSESLRASELETGVDTDQEMQTLLMVEQSYAANARVIQTIEQLIDALMRI